MNWESIENIEFLKKLGKKIFDSEKKKKNHVKNINKFFEFLFSWKKYTKCWVFLFELDFLAVLTKRKKSRKSQKSRKNYEKKNISYSKEKKIPKKVHWKIFFEKINLSFSLNKKREKTSKLMFLRNFQKKIFHLINEFSKEKKNRVSSLRIH